MPGKNVIIISLALMISSPNLAALPVTKRQKNPVTTSSQQETKQVKDKKPASDTQSQEKKVQSKDDAQKQKGTTDVSDKQNDAKASAETPEEKRKKLVTQAIQNLEDAVSQSKELHPLLKLKIRGRAADGLWHYQEERAKEILTEDFRSLASINAPKTEPGKRPAYKRRDFEQIKESLRYELLTIISSHDPALAKSLLEAGKTGKEGEPTTKEQMLAAATSMAETNPEMAARIFRDSLKTGLSPDFVNYIMSLCGPAPEEASALFNEALAIVRASGDILAFADLTSYVLPNQVDLIVGGDYLANPLRAKDAKSVTELAVILLVRQLEAPQASADSSQELIKREINLWRELIPLFSRFAPEKVEMVTRRIRQLTLQLATQSSAQPSGQLGPPTVQLGSNETALDIGSSFSKRLKKQIADAESAVGEKRDNLFASAAFSAVNLGDLEQAMSLVERIENLAQKEVASSNILFPASMRVLKNEGPDKGLALVRHIKDPWLRVQAYGRVSEALRAGGRKEEIKEMQEELFVWLTNCDNNADKVGGLLNYLNHFGNINVEKGFEALNTIVPLLNKVDFAPPLKPMPGKNYWDPEFHDFRMSLSHLAKADFWRAWEQVQMIKNKDVSLLMNVTLSNEFLKADRQKQAAEAKKVSK